MYVNSSSTISEEKKKHSNYNQHPNKTELINSFYPYDLPFFSLFVSFTTNEGMQGILVE